MRPHDLQEFTRKRPFLPYRIHTIDGATYDIRHPDQVILLRWRAMIAVGGENGVADHVDHVALSHIVRIEELESGGSSAARCSRFGSFRSAEASLPTPHLCCRSD